MNAIVGLFVALFVIINLFQGTLGIALFQIAVAGLIPIGIKMLGACGCSREKEAACRQLEADIALLKRCHRKIVDPELCKAIGADAATIRQTIRQASVLISMLESYTGQSDQHIEELFGGRAPSLSQCAAVISELRFRRQQLSAWLDDTARRDIMISTGQHLTPPQVGDEIRQRGAAIAAIRRDGSGWAALDNVAAPIAGVVTFFAFDFGLVCSGLYAAVRVVSLLGGYRERYSRPALEPTDCTRSEYARKSARRLTDVNRILLGRNAGSAAAGRRIDNGRSSGRRRIEG